MRSQSRTYIRKLLEMHGPFTRVLDVGSFDVSGNVRDLFESSEYIGVDMRKGENVDQVVNGHDLVAAFGKESFDLVLCFDTLEHDNAFWVTVEQMKQVLRPKGILALGAPGRNCPYHAHPDDYWRFMEPAMRELLSGLEDIQFEAQFDDGNHTHEDEVYGVGRKP